MINSIRNTLREIQRGENLDIYLTVILAVVIAILSLFQLASLEIISAAILATLSLLATFLLVNRRSASEIKDTTTQLGKELKLLRQEIERPPRISEVLSEGYPDFSRDIRLAKNISILAISLSSMITRHYTDFAQVLKQGGSLRFIVSEPSPEILKMLVYRSSSTKDASVFSSTIQNHLARLKALGETSGKTGSLQVRTIPYISPYGIIIIEHPNGISDAYVKLYSFQNSDQQHPSFKVNSQAENEWFQFFREQFERFWANAKDVV